MKFQLCVGYADTENPTWIEMFDDHSVKTQEEAEAFCRKTVAWFNDTLRPGEKARRYVSVNLIGESEVHDWRKSNLVTVANHRGTHDVMKCEACGITGKRFGIGGGVTRDSKYRAKKYAKCVPGAAAELARRTDNE